MVKYVGVVECQSIMSKMKWDKVCKNGPSKLCGRQSLKNLRGSSLLIVPKSLQIITLMLSNVETGKQKLNFMISKNWNLSAFAFDF